MPLIMIRRGLDPTALGTAMTAYLVGTLVALFFGGNIIDARSKSRVMGLAAVVTASLLGFIAADLGKVLESPLILSIVVFGLGCADALYGPAAEAVIPEIAGEATLAKVNSWMSIAESLAAKVVGPSLAGVAVYAMDPRTFIIGLAVLSGVSGLLAFSLRLPTVESSTPPQNPLAGFGDGLRVIRSASWLWLGLLWSALALLFQYGARTVVLPFDYAQNGDPGGFAVGMTALGLGALTGGLLMSKWGSRIAGFRPMVYLWVGGSLMWAAIAVAPSSIIVAVLLFLMGAMNAAGNVSWSTLLQAAVTPEFRGRVASADWLVSISLMPASTALAGFAAQTHLMAWMLTAAIVPTLLGVIILTRRREVGTAGIRSTASPESVQR